MSSEDEQTPLERLEAIVDRFEIAVKGSGTWTTKRIVGTVVALLVAAGGGGYGGASVKTAQTDWRLGQLEDTAKGQQSQNQQLVLHAQAGLADVAGLKVAVVAHDREIGDLRETVRTCCMGKRSSYSLLPLPPPAITIDFAAPPPTPPWELSAIWGP